MAGSHYVRMQYIPLSLYQTFLFHSILQCLLGYIWHVVQMRLCCVSHFSSCLHLSQCSPILFFFSDCFISVLLRAGQQSPWSPGQHTIVSLCVTAVSSTGVSIPKAPFLFVLLSGGAAALSVVRYHQFSANHQHILCNLLQSISTDASCLQPDNIPQ